MSHLPGIPPEAAAGELKELYEQFQRTRGPDLPEHMRVMGRSPRVLKAMQGVTAQLMHPDSALGLRRAEMIATHVSRINAAGY
jgi:alkylhydroperoxidase family enzyme